MALDALLRDLAEAFDGARAFERRACAALIEVAGDFRAEFDVVSLPAPVTKALLAPKAHPVCRTIAETPLPWASPRVSNDPAYLAISAGKVHVEFIGPDGFIPSRSSRARTNRSISWRGHASSRTAGTAGLRGARNAQWSP